MTTIKVRVPTECTLKEAVERVHGNNQLTTIVLEKGEHNVEETERNTGYRVDPTSNTLVIPSAMYIVGDPGVSKEEIVFTGGIFFKKGIQGNCQLKNLTVRPKSLVPERPAIQGRPARQGRPAITARPARPEHSATKVVGVHGKSSFTMEDVVVERCGYHGVYAHGTDVVGKCTNVEVRQCGMSGVVAAGGASITLIGAKTTVQHNCTRGRSEDYGLQLVGSSSTIQLVSPLTKEQASTDNGGGGNWVAGNGADNQISVGLGLALRLALRL